MSVVTELINSAEKVNSSNDGIVIQLNLESKRGGTTLDVSALPASVTVIKAGHIIIKDASNNYKAMPLNAGATAYEALPASHTYEGVVIASVLRKRPMVGVLLRGTVNIVASPYPVAGILTAFKAAMPLIRWTQD